MIPLASPSDFLKGLGFATAVFFVGPSSKARSTWLGAWAAATKSNYANTNNAQIRSPFLNYSVGFKYGLDVGQDFRVILDLGLARYSVEELLWRRPVRTSMVLLSESVVHFVW